MSNEVQNFRQAVERFDEIIIIMEKAKEDLEKTRNEITNIDKLRSDLRRLQINQSQLINDFDSTVSYIDDKNIENSNKIISKFENIEKNWNKDFLGLETNLKSKFENIEKELISKMKNINLNDFTLSVNTLFENKSKELKNKLDEFESINSKFTKNNNLLNTLLDIQHKKVQTKLSEFENLIDSLSSYKLILYTLLGFGLGAGTVFVLYKIPFTYFTS